MEDKINNNIRLQEGLKNIDRVASSVIAKAKQEIIKDQQVQDMINKRLAICSLCPLNNNGVCDIKKLMEINTGEVINRSDVKGKPYNVMYWNGQVGSSFGVSQNRIEEYDIVCFRIGTQTYVQGCACNIKLKSPKKGNKCPANKW